MHSNWGSTNQHSQGSLFPLQILPYYFLGHTSPQIYPTIFIYKNQQLLLVGLEDWKQPRTVDFPITLSYCQRWHISGEMRWTHSAFTITLHFPVERIYGHPVQRWGSKELFARDCYWSSVLGSLEKIRSQLGTWGHRVIEDIGFVPSCIGMLHYFKNWNCPPSVCQLNVTWMKGRWVYDVL